MQRGDKGHPLAGARVKNRGAEQGEEVMDVNEIWAVLTQIVHKRVVRAGAPDDPSGKESLFGCCPGIDLLTEPLEALQSVAALAQSSGLIVDNPVLAARGRGPVAVVHLEDFQAKPPAIGIQGPALRTVR